MNEPPQAGHSLDSEVDLGGVLHSALQNLLFHVTILKASPHLSHDLVKGMKCRLW